MKKILLIFASVFIMFFSCACHSDKPSILFNAEKITEENVMNYTSVFSQHQRIYYLILIPKRINTSMIEIQIIKKDNKYERLGYKLFWTYSARLKEEQIYYYDDYVVIPEKGAYIMKVFSKDNPTKVLCMAQFFVR